MECLEYKRQLRESLFKIGSISTIGPSISTGSSSSSAITTITTTSHTTIDTNTTTNTNTTTKRPNENEMIHIKKQIKKTTIKNHPKYKLQKVLSGHVGWVRSIAIDHSNEWFASGSGDRLIKIWDLPSGTLKLSLTGHVSTIRSLQISKRLPYLFSVGEDKMIKCWDLTCNKVIRQYHGHLSGIYSSALHPDLDLLVTGGRDSTARVWDIRTKQQIFALTGHLSTVTSIITQSQDPQVITGSADSTLKLWDLRMGKTITTLTHHKKSIRSVAGHPKEFSFCSAGGGLRLWRGDGVFVDKWGTSSTGSTSTMINCLDVNEDGVLVSGGDDGSLQFFDYSSLTPYQTLESIPQPGSIDSEKGIFCCKFDQTGTRVFTGEADKSIKVYKLVE